MNLQILVIDSRIGAVIGIKQALEQTGNFQAYPFTDAYAALDFLSTTRVDVVVTDMHLSDYPGLELIESIRLAQQDVTIIASTSKSTTASKAIAAGAAGLVQAKYNARELLETIQQLLAQSTTEQPPANPSEPAVSEEATAVFEKLAAEEPPLPNFRQGGTITTFMARVSDDELNNLLDSINEAMEIDTEDDLLGMEPEIDDEDTQPDTPAQFILEDVVGDTIPLDVSPFKRYLDNIRGEAPPGKAAEYIEEPDFLDDNPFFIDQFNQTTQASESQLRRIQEDQERVDTATLESNTPLDEPGDQLTESLNVPAIPPEDTPEASQRVDPPDEVSAQIAPFVPDDDANADPRIAQMAVSLTRASLESAADTILLLREGEVVAYEGELADEDIDKIVTAINEKEVGQKKARIQFITLNNVDYLIYSRRTEDDFVLSMVCEGGTSMTEIRTQARRLLKALAAVPQMAPEDLMEESEPDEPEAAKTKPSKGGMRLVAAADATPGLLTKYTFLWLPHDPDFTLEYEMAETIDSGMRTQLAERGWKIDFLEVQEDYLYIVAGVPGDVSPQQRARELQRLSAEIATTLDPTLDAATLWAESYFVLAPGRELNVQEIQQYINFHRI